MKRHNGEYPMPIVPIPGWMSATELEWLYQRARGHQTIVGMFPADIGLRAEDAARLQIDFWLKQQKQMPGFKGKIDVPVGQPKGTVIHLDTKFFGRVRT